MRNRKNKNKSFQNNIKQTLDMMRKEESKYTAGDLQFIFRHYYIYQSVENVRVLS